MHQYPIGHPTEAGVVVSCVIIVFHVRSHQCGPLSQRWSLVVIPLPKMASCPAVTQS